MQKFAYEIGSLSFAYLASYSASKFGQFASKYDDQISK